jgi:hypothetical protein
MSLGLDIPCKDWYPDKPRTMPLYIRSFPRLGQTEYCVHSYLRIPYFNIMKFTLLGPHAFLYELPMEQIRVPEPHDQVDTVSPGEHQAVITNIYCFLRAFSKIDRRRKLWDLLLLFRPPSQNKAPI